jgi:hypothetical protein
MKLTEGVEGRVVDNVLMRGRDDCAVPDCELSLMPTWMFRATASVERVRLRNSAARPRPHVIQARHSLRPARVRLGEARMAKTANVTTPDQEKCHRCPDTELTPMS